MSKRKVTPLHKDERAIISTLDVFGDDVTLLKHYGTVVDLSPTGLQILTRGRFTVGEQLEIAIHMEGRTEACSFSGVARWVAASSDDIGYLVGVEVMNNAHGAQWRHKFH